MSAGTLKVRRLLIVVGCLGFIMVAGGVYPTAVPAIGVTLEMGDKKVMLWALALMLCYLLVQFYLRVRVESTRLTKVWLKYGFKQIGADGVGEDEPEIDEPKPVLELVLEDRETMPLREIRKVFVRAGMRFKLMVCFDYLLPLVLGFGALVLAIIRIFQES